ncbi:MULTISPECIES: DUF6542 domain-containing protein [unclassified Kitasatospora]|uniref:DUF6542 domain-containing protein n=1 Tax=unclassified Kitasatospora TaxID=2633591 RepID=UPI003405EC63
MAGQRARTPYQDAGPRTEDRAFPAQRSHPAGGAVGEGGAADAGGAGAERSARAQRAGVARRRQQARWRGGLVAALSAVGLPVLGGVADELGGPGVGLLFAVGSVLGPGIAAALCSRPGRWWVVTAAPIVVLLAASGVEYVAHPARYQGKNLGTGALRWVVGAFPVMAAAVGVALAVVVGRAVADRRRAVADRRRPDSSGVPTGGSRRG